MITIPRTNGDITLSLPEATQYFYRFHNTENSKNYIGRTNNIERRITQHLAGEGSPSLLADLVDFGRQAFQISIIDVITTQEEQIHDKLEDHYIRQFDAIANGYNCRYNAPIVPNSDEIDLNNIEVSAKYVFDRDGQLVFSVGEFSQALSYQLLVNVRQHLLDSDIRSPPIVKKQKFDFNYLQILCNPRNNDFQPNTVFDLRLKYNYIDNTLEILHSL
jgi:hypothetical protein